MNPEFRQSCDLVRRGVEENVISTTPRALAKWRGWDTQVLQATMANVTAEWQAKPDPSPWLGQQSSWQLPETRRYQQSRMPPVGAPLTQPVAGQDWMVELGRWPVPDGMVGIVKSFEQFVSQGEETYTASQYWGNPFPPGSAGIRWFLRLSSLHLIAGPWRNASGLSAIPEYLPGIPYDDFPRTDDIWFPAGASSGANIHLPIPGGQFLRLMAIVEASQTVIRIAGRMAGTIQSETSRDAQFVLRTSW